MLVGMAVPLVERSSSLQVAVERLASLLTGGGTGLADPAGSRLEFEAEIALRPLERAVLAPAEGWAVGGGDQAIGAVQGRGPTAGRAGAGGGRLARSPRPVVGARGPQPGGRPGGGGPPRPRCPVRVPGRPVAGRRAGADAGCARRPVRR